MTPTLYELQRELAGIIPGALFELQEIEAGAAYFLVDPPEVCAAFGTVALSRPMVEDRPDWFQPAQIQPLAV